jgi:hypothetical protein
MNQMPALSTSIVANLFQLLPQRLHVCSMLRVHCIDRLFVCSVVLGYAVPQARRVGIKLRH